MKKIYILILMIFSFVIVGCSEYHPKIEDYTWEFQIAYYSSEEYYNSKDPIYLATNEKYSNGWTSAPVKNIDIYVKDNNVVITNTDTNKEYFGHIRIKQNDKNNTTTYSAEIEGQEVNGGNLVGEWQVQYVKEKDQWYELTNAPYHLLVGYFKRDEPVFDEDGNEKMIEFTYVFQFISFIK